MNQSRQQQQSLNTSGPPLLDASETNALDTFFDNPDDFTGAGALQDFHMADYGANYNFKAGGELPPSLRLQNEVQNTGTPVTGFPHNNFGGHNMDQLGRMSSMGNYNSFDTFQLVNAGTDHDVLNAADILSNTSQHQHQQIPHHLQSPVYHPGRQTPADAYAPNLTTQHTYPTSSHIPNNGHYHGSMDGAMAYGNAAYAHNHAVPRARNSAPGPMYQFGSDNTFTRNGYIAPSNQKSDEEIAQNLMTYPRHLSQPQPSGTTSAEDTYASSPVEQERLATGVTEYMYHDDGEDDEPIEQPKARKRRKKSSSEDDRDYSPTSRPGPKVPKASYSEETKGVNPNSSRRRKSSAAAMQDSSTTTKAGTAAAAAAAAAARKNLTDEQKRNNHIKSEQKRRNQIKVSYEELGDLVPNLKQGGFSRAAAIQETIRYLEELLAGNEKVEAHLNGVRDPALQGQ
ncbi:hypothetical protein M8818_001633 [Zalaria obscura]|uniref:Uncharacterized protein n=1 Tax=Zalaria obscura TaxID=2024903 RepID=A0ACC3SMC7_9PEZI